MSKMSEMVIEIEELATEGCTAKEIAKILSLPLGQVESVLESMDADLYEDEVEEYDEGDDAYALASAGFGTDEDYGSFNSDYY